MTATTATTTIRRKVGTSVGVTITSILVSMSLLLCTLNMHFCESFPIMIRQSSSFSALSSSLLLTSSPTTTSITTRPTTTRLNAANKNTNFLDNLFSSLTSAVATKEIIPPSKPKYENVIIEPDFRIAGLFLVLGILLDTIPYIQLTLGPFVTLLGILFVVQTFRIRFVFTEDNQFELKTVSLSSSFSKNTDDGAGDTEVAALRDSGENVIVGGANVWDCDTIVNYDFFPRSMMDLPLLGQPVLIYFKETQTPASTWNEGPGKIANDPDKIANGIAIPGQVHFFPAICNAKQIEQEFQKRNVQKL